MIKLPTQFDARGRQHIEAASAGGSTSTSCSSCIVTVSTAAVASTLYFAELHKRAERAQASKAAAISVSASASDDNESREDSPAPIVGARPAPTQTRATPKPHVLLDSWWLCTIVGGFSLWWLSGFGLTGVALGTAISAGLMFTHWIRVHQRAGVGLGKAIAIGVVINILFAIAMVLEAFAWIGLN